MAKQQKEETVEVVEFILLEELDLKQRHVEAWTREMRAEKPADLEGIGAMPVPEYNGATIRAAIRAGWFEDVGEDRKAQREAIKAAGELSYVEADELAERIWALYRAVTTIDAKN